jgi:glycosyltransferase involved in cell wall biosynthesis
MTSIITPSFRQPDWLRLCAASVADQEGVQYEHIVQEGSDDARVESSVSQFPKLRLYREPDSGMYDAINRGLAKARGDICAYLNCDEQYLPGALAQVANFFDLHPEIDVLFGDAILADSQGNPISYRRTVLPTLAHVRYVRLNTPTCSTFFRRTLIDRGFLFDPEWKVIGDQLWMENLLGSGVSMATLREPLAIFTFTGENLSLTNVSLEEDGRLNRSRSIIAGLRKAAAIIWLRTRKLFAGAYRSRKIEIEIYTPESPSTRQRKQARVGFSWPRN